VKTAAALTRSDTPEPLTAPPPDTVIEAGTDIVLIGSPGQEKRFNQAFQRLEFLARPAMPSVRAEFGVAADPEASILAARAHEEVSWGEPSPSRHGNFLSELPFPGGILQRMG
jgi:hypothetical protein